MAHTRHGIHELPGDQCGSPPRQSHTDSSLSLPAEPATSDLDGYSGVGAGACSISAVWPAHVGMKPYPRQHNLYHQDRLVVRLGTVLLRREALEEAGRYSTTLRAASQKVACRGLLSSCRESSRVQCLQLARGNFPRGPLVRYMREDRLNPFIWADSQHILSASPKRAMSKCYSAA